MLNNSFFSCFYCKYEIRLYICTVFFMVLELRLTKIGCRDDNQFFLCPYLTCDTSPSRCEKIDYPQRKSIHILSSTLCRFLCVCQDILVAQRIAHRYDMRLIMTDTCRKAAMRHLHDRRQGYGLREVGRLIGI